MGNVRILKALTDHRTAELLDRVPTGDDKVRRPFSMDKALLRRAKQAATDLECQTNDVYKVALLEWLASYEKAGGRSGASEDPGRRTGGETDLDAMALMVKSNLKHWPKWRSGKNNPGAGLYWDRVMVEVMTLLKGRRDGMTAEDLVDCLSTVTKLEARLADEPLSAKLLAHRIRMRMKHHSFFRKEDQSYYLVEPVLPHG